MTKKEANITFSALFDENSAVIIKEARPIKIPAKYLECSTMPDIKAYLTKNDLINYAKNGIDIREYKKMKNATSFDEVDLHGLTQVEAFDALNTKVNYTNSQYLRVIHGKGKEICIIKSLAFEFAKSNAKVLAVISLADASGESGVMMFLLRV